MRRSAASLLLALIAMPACSGMDETRGSHDAAREPAARNLKTAPAAGLWSHRFVRWSDGTITAVGFSRKPTGIGLVRYLPTGAIDRSFRRIVHREFGAGRLDALATVRAGRDGLFIAACQPPDCGAYFVLGRFRRDGSLDPSFGDRGIVRTSGPAGSIEPRALAVQSDGKIVVAGEVSKRAVRQAFLARYLPDGRRDAAFGREGLVVTETMHAFTAVAVQTDGRIVAAGHRLNQTTHPASSNVRIARYRADGQLDRRFATGGVAGSSLMLATTLLIGAHGKIVVAGSGGPAGRPVFGLARLRAAGTHDRTFGRTGQVLDRRPGDHWARVEALTRLRDGSLVATGWATRGGAVPTRRSRIVLLALRPSGALVRSFGEGGRITLATVVAKGQAAFQTTPRRLLVVGPDDDLAPRRVVFATVSLPPP